MAVTGLTLSRFGDGMRVPVTTTSETSSEVSVWAIACDDRPIRAAPQIIEDANRRSRMDLNFTVWILQRTCLDGRPLPTKRDRSRRRTRPRLQRSYEGRAWPVNEH